MKEYENGFVNSIKLQNQIDRNWQGLTGKVYEACRRTYKCILRNQRTTKYNIVTLILSFPFSFFYNFYEIFKNKITIIIIIK